MNWRKITRTITLGVDIDHRLQGKDEPDADLAIARVLGNLSPGALDAFRQEQAGTAAAVQAGCTVFDCDMRDGLPIPLKLSDRQQPLWQEIAATLERQGRFGAGIAMAAHLALVIDGNDERPTRIIVLGDEMIAQILRGILRHGDLTATELHLLKQLICGAGLAEAARTDGVSHETRRTQFRSLSRKFGVRSQGELAARALTQILINQDIAPVLLSQATDDLFVALGDEFLPGARCHKLQAPGGTHHRFIDLGPADGRPVIFIHPQIMPDLRPEDMAVLRETGLRLIVPLRHGAMSGGGFALSVSDHLDHACEAIDLAREHFSGAQGDLLACISGVSYGIEYARRYPGRVASLAFAGAPASLAAGDSAVGQLRIGLFRLATSDGGLFSRVMDFLGRRINRPETFRRLLANYYRHCPADLAIVDAEYAAPHGGERVRKQITASMRSIRQDLYHQARPRWNDLPKGRFPVAFFHGARDVFYPVMAVRALADDLGGYPVYSVPEAGQLLYYRHFVPLLEAYHAFVTDARNR